MWSSRWGGLRWVDMLRGDVLQLAEDGSVRRTHVDDVAAALRPRRGGGAVIGVRRGFALEDPDGAVTHLPELWSGDEIRMNEGGCDPDGRFFCGTMAYDQRPGAASLYRLDADRSVTIVLERRDDLQRAGVEPRRHAGLLRRHADPRDRRLRLRQRRRAARTGGRSRPSTAMPDGLTVDAEGGVWVALYDGRAVQHYARRTARRARRGARPRGPRDGVHVRRRATSTGCSSRRRARDCRPRRSRPPGRCSSPTSASAGCRCASSPVDVRLPPGHDRGGSNA